MRASPRQLEPRELLLELQPLGTIVAPDVLHLALDHLAEVRRGVHEVPMARVDPDVGYASLVSSLFEEDHVSGAQLRLRHLAAFVLPLPGFAHGQLVPELLVDLLGQAGATHELVRAGAEPVLGADVSPRRFDHTIARGLAARRYPKYFLVGYRSRAKAR
jgi:hypothetical protein